MTDTKSGKRLDYRIRLKATLLSAVASGTITNGAMRNYFRSIDRIAGGDTDALARLTKKIATDIATLWGSPDPFAAAA